MTDRGLKAQSNSITTLPARKLICGLLSLALLLFALSDGCSLDAVWLGNPGSGGWNTGSNWTSGIAPVNAGDTAIFNTSTVTSLGFPGTGATVSSITFNAGASSFTIGITLGSTPPAFLHLVGVGVVNGSGAAQTIAISSFGNNQLLFSQGATAGNVTITNEGNVEFFDSATAGNATITNSGNILFPQPSSRATFNNSATAGNSTIVNDGGHSRVGAAVRLFSKTLRAPVVRPLLTKVVQARV